MLRSASTAHGHRTGIGLTQPGLARRPRHVAIMRQIDDHGSNFIAAFVNRSVWASPTTLEHFPIWRNRGGFPSAANSDSCLGLAEEASPHGQASFERSA